MSIPADLLSFTAWLPFLAELAAKATLVLLVTAIAAALLWRSSAAVRHLVWCAGLVGVLALPLFSALLPRWELPLLPAAEAPVVAYRPDPSFPQRDAARAAAPASSAESTVAVGVAETAWLPRAAGMLALSGVAAGLLWLAVGFWGVARLGRRSQVVRDPEWLRATQDAAEMLGLRRPVLLLRGRGAGMPATGGILWPVVVIPAVADEWPEDRRRAVLAHELAHVKRFDCLTQALAQVACALFWWHPAVWYAARRLRVERERACDDLVLRAGTRASDYAAHLLEIARLHRGQRLAAPALVSMARPSHLESRLLWVLDAARARGVPSTRATALSVALALVAAGSLAALRPTEALAENAAAADPRRSAEDGEVSVDVGQAMDVRVGVRAEVNVDPRLYLRATGDGRMSGATPGAARGDTFPEVEELIAMRAVGVDAAYIAELRAAGLDRLSGSQLIALAGSGVTGAYAREMKDAGFGRLTAEQLASLHAVGVTPEYVAWLRRSGHADLTPEGAASLKAVGVDEAFIAEMARAGYRGIAAQELANLAAVGVTPEYVAELRRAGITTPSASLLASLRAQDVTGAYIAELRALGIDGLDAEQLGALRSLGVDRSYVRGLAAEGITDLDASDLVALAGLEVTPAYVRELKAAGFATLTAEQLVRLRASGVDRDLVRSRRP